MNDEVRFAYIDAARKIAEHNRIHSHKEPNSLWITEILDCTTQLYNDLANERLHLVGTTKNLSEIAFCDNFICQHCGIHLKDWCKVEEETYEDGYIDEALYEYEFKFCPECGAKIKE